ncbi:MAG TPA: hypothetical protein VKE40_02915 [Gemmataceae bacterium]|nr:hypothetical protein [Gemmataceae bacterium]
MVRRFLPMLALVLTVSLLASGQEAKDGKDKEKDKDKKDEAPKSNIVKAPEGWKYVKAKDMSHAFLVPREVKSEERSEGSFKSGDFSGKTATYVATLKDGRTLVVVQTNLGGPGTKDMKIKDVYDLMYDADKAEKGVKISEPKEITVGKRKGQEYFVTDKDSVRRVVTVVVPGRVIQLVVEADKREKLMEKDCDTFLTSLILYAPPKKDAKKDEAPKKEPPKDK